MLRVVVLGAAAGGGVPQWNCGCPVCQAARTSNPELQSTQASLAVSADGDHWFLINASPDLRQQLTTTPQLHPAPGKLRHSPVTGVILTNGEIDAITGLLSMREGSPFTIYGHEKVLATLKSNSVFNVLNEKNVKRQGIEIDQAFEPKLPDGSPSGIEMLPFEATGKFFYFRPACPEVTDGLKSRLKGASLVFFDGTVWRDDELIAAGLSTKTGRGMGHIAMSGETGAIAALENLGIERKIFLHINNSNPALLHDSEERKAVMRAGWQIPADGTEFTL